MMFDIIIIAIALILVFIALYNSIYTFKTITEAYVKRTWVVYFAFIGFLLVSYICYILMIAITIANTNTIRTLTGIIFFNIAVFTVVIIWFNKKVIEKNEFNTRVLGNMNVVLKDEVKKSVSKIKESDRLKELFVHIMYEEVRNPLNSLKEQITKLIKNSKDDKIKSEYLKIINEADEMDSLIVNARLYSKLRDEKIADKKMNIDLNRLLNSISSVYLEKAALKNISIINESDYKKNFYVPLLPFAHEVFRNIIDNAIKHSPNNSAIRIVINETKEDTTVSILDNGKGISDKNKECIFNRFEEDKEKGGIEGTGLGLAICKHIMELHDGEIWVNDNPMGGSIFNIKFPNEKQMEKYK
ncbi:HAMP domain-containing histidine kinase [archaeon]|jgi:signal transduction histidine kinase|nr:HAMP domain-containing histidine kinase [archaeon]MBT4352155.1 HAMP domain-containing histidine kinase [archaeon]MBT4648281.1 HAMP domain-containing histidine kinase [archaeon]MBT6821533.1 HAMP domain-containing histidine kinase [archaeon]MBT7391932.1 HAMP domain-containing histidine kinase [archaeon]